jgi:glycolate oxidase FAD binding subunit
LELRTIVRPTSVAELGEQVRQSASTGQAIYPLGGRTQLHLGLPPERPGIGIDLTGLAQLIDYPARDMTITVQAGLRIGELQRLLIAERQRLPIDIPHPEQATLGGAIATNTSGSRRLGSGTLRDYLIGISTINDEGQETKAGGRVVKNVAGYDLCKLHTGALGTLGIISQVTLKVRPCPEAQALVTFGCESSLEKLLDDLHASRTRPMCVDLVNAPVARLLRTRSGVLLPERPWIVIVGFEDSEHAVNWQIQQLLRELTTAGIHGGEALAGAATEPLWQALTELTAQEQGTLALKASVLSGRVAPFVESAARQWTAGEVLIHAHAGSGVVRLQLMGEGSMGDVQRYLAVLGQEAPSRLIVQRCPPAWKRTLPVWGVPGNDVALMQKVKQAIDPRRLFNPGRFVAGI